MNRTTRTLLIVDDCPEDRELYRRYLVRDPDYSYNILEATLGEEGLQLWRQEKPDAILLDYRLPDLDGLEFLARLQPTSKQPCSVIIVTGEGSEAIAVQAIKAGAEDYLVKEEITRERLQMAINGAISTARLRSQLQQRIERERLVGEITRKIHQSLDLEEILQTAVTEVRRFLHSDRVLIFQLQSQNWGLVITESAESGWTSLLSTSYHDPCLDGEYLESLQEGEVILKSDINDGSIAPCYGELLARLQVRASLVTPILQHGRLSSLLIVHHCAAPREWQPLEVDLLKEVAIQVGIALQKAELYQQAQNELAERKLVEGELRESQRRLQLALEAARMGTWEWDIQNRRLHWSDNLEAMFGLKAGEFDGSFEMFADRLHPDDRDRVLAVIEEAITTGEDYTVEFRVVYPDGRIRWAQARGKVFYGENRQPLRMVGIDLDITERKRSQRALQDSEERFRTSVENMLDCFGIYSAVRNERGEIADFRVEYVNDAACHTNQMSREEQVGRLLCEIFPGIVDNGLFAEYCRVVETGQPLARENLVYDGNVGEKYLVKALDVRVAKFGDGFVTTWRDISDRKRAEAALADNEARLQGFVDANVVGILHGDIYGNVFKANDKLLRMVGYTREDLDEGRMSWVDMTPPEYLPLDEARIGEARERGACTPYEKEYIRKDGTRIPVLIGYSLVGEAREESVAFILDLSDRKRAEERLRESEERLRLGMQVAGFGLARVDYASNTVELSPQAAKLYGFSPEELVISREQIHATFHPEERQELAEIIRQVLDPAGPGWFSRDHRVVWGDGEVKWLTVRKQVFFHRSGGKTKPSHAILVAIDITDRKQIEIQRARLLEQEQAARQEAERVNRIKDEFLAVLSHELRSPLNPILGWSRLLQTRTLDDATAAQGLAAIERNVKLQLQLINDLLDMAKILRGKLSLNPTSVDLSAAIEGAIETVRTAAAAKSIRLRSTLQPTEPVMGDAARLQQIVWNLLSNAIKFTPEGGEVKIGLEQVGHEAQITVSDTGKGISPEFIPRIFQAFHQEDASITRQHGGLGLGLAIVRQLVEGHGGTIGVESEGLGRGATFKVLLPLPKAKLDPDTAIGQVSPQKLDLTGVRVLVVDDEPDARELSAVLLRQYGAEVRTLAAAAEVIPVLASFRPNLLVSDIGMPDMDGYTLIQNIRALPASEGGDVPAIALTAYAREGDRRRALMCGYQAHLTKPIEIEEFLQAVAFTVTSEQ